MQTYHIWAPKGGVGGSTTAAILAAKIAKKHPSETVELAVSPEDVGDLYMILGLDYRYHSRASTTLDDGVKVTNNLKIVAASHYTNADYRVVDCGHHNPHSDAALEPVRDNDTVIAVVRNCYLSIRKLHDADNHPNTTVVCIEEIGRANRPSDISAAFDNFNIIHIRAESDISRAVDAGLLLYRISQGKLGTTIDLSLIHI